MEYNNKLNTPNEIDNLRKKATKYLCALIIGTIIFLPLGAITNNTLIIFAILIPLLYIAFMATYYVEKRRKLALHFNKTGQRQFALLSTPTNFAIESYFYNKNYEVLSFSDAIFAVKLCQHEKFNLLAGKHNISSFIIALNGNTTKEVTDRYSIDYSIFYRKALGTMGISPNSLEAFPSSAEITITNSLSREQLEEYNNQFKSITSIKIFADTGSKTLLYPPSINTTLFKQSQHDEVISLTHRKEVFNFISELFPHY